MQTQPLKLLVWVHFSWADFDRDDFFKGISRIIVHNHVHFYSLNLQVLPSIFASLECRSLLQTDILHASCTVLNYKSGIGLFLALTPALKVRIFISTVLGGVVIL